jgi:uncharacterized protein YdcH (DUF465 family)
MELNTQDELKAHLIATDEHFRTLNNQHHEYDARLEALEAMSHPTEEEQLEEVRLKKLKLHLKDQIMEALSRHKMEQVVS